ncbi:MAG: L-iditol 2-dehydrogenase [Verrucomicrobiales bacterium]|jgi:L-iditol 2-dehydrogenase
MIMKALNLAEYNKFEYIDSPKPEITDDEVLIQIKACGICGSDIHGMDGSSGRRQPPIIMGHEASGVICQVGAGLNDWKVGDRVTFDSTVYCGNCDQCKKGDVNLCQNRRVLGVSCDDYRQNGAFAEYLKVPARILYRMPENLTFEQAAFAEPISIALHGVSLVPVKQGDTAVVVGAGLIGLLVVQALRIAGAEKVIAVDLDEKRLSLAKELGAAVTFNATDPDVLNKIRQETGGQGADISMEVVGISPTLNLAIHCLRTGGSAGLVGNLSAVTEFPMQAVVTREISIFGSCASAGEYADALKHIESGAIKIEPLISAAVPLSEGAEWFERLHGNKEGLLKVILQP